MLSAPDFLPSHGQGHNGGLSSNGLPRFGMGSRAQHRSCRHSCLLHFWLLPDLHGSLRDCSRTMMFRIHLPAPKKGASHTRKYNVNLPACQVLFFCASSVGSSIGRLICRYLCCPMMHVCVRFWRQRHQRRAFFHPVVTAVMLLLNKSCVLQISANGFLHKW